MRRAIANDDSTLRCATPRSASSTSRSLALLCSCALALLVGCAKDEAAVPHPELIGQSITHLQAAIESGDTSSEALVQAYLARIEALDKNGPRLGSVIATNPDALEQARTLDRERKEGRLRGPLHGIPILIKDNIETADPMPTTAGSLALADNVTNRDAPLVANLRAAGAIILGKANLSEWANFRSEHSVSGWSAIGGFTKNPHVLDRSPCGSSSGSAVAVAAGLVTASIGTETDGSITCPASMNGIVGLKPTVGLLSAQHIVPIAHSQDTAGPMGITVRDVAIVLDAMVGSEAACEPPAQNCRRGDYLGALSHDALAGKRIGVLRFEHPRQPQIAPVYEKALRQLRDAGATLIDLKEPEMGPIYEAEDRVLHVEFKAHLNEYLATLPDTVSHRTLADLIEFNRNESRELAWFGQEIFVKANATAGLDDPEYRQALETAKRRAGAEGIDRMLAENKLDFIVAPTTGTAWRIDLINGDHFPGFFSTLPAVSGYPHLTVPMGEVQGLPLGLSFIGPAWSEDRLLAAGFAFEHLARVSIHPKFVPSIEAAADASAAQKGRR